MNRIQYVGAVTVAVAMLASDPSLSATPLADGGSDGCGGLPSAVDLGATSPPVPISSDSTLEQRTDSFCLGGGNSGGVGGVPATKQGLQSCFIGDPHSAGGIPSKCRMDPRSVGGIPCTGNPAFTSWLAIPHALTVGLVIDSTNSPIPNTPVLILSASGSVIAATTTDDLGAFALNLPKVSGLTLELPSLNVFDVPVTAGDPLLILIP